MTGNNVHASAIVQYAVEGIKAVILINGGAAIAVATFIGHVEKTNIDVNMLILALTRFAYGALAGVVTFALSYIAQVFSYELRVRVGDSRAKYFNALRVLAMIAVVVSGVLFVCGVVAIGNSYGAHSVSAPN